MLRTMLGLATVAAVATAVAVVPAQAGSTKKVSVTNNAFTPKALTVKKGTKVVWRWTQGGVPHNVTPANGKRGSATSSKKGFTFSKVMSRTGTFKYVCTVHPDAMRLTIRVR